MSEATRAFVPFVQVPKWILDLGPAHLAVYAALMAFDGERGCFPSVAHLADRARVSATTAKKVLRDLVTEGAISVSRRTRSDGGQSSNLYDLRPAWTRETPPARDAQGGRREAPTEQDLDEQDPLSGATAPDAVSSDPPEIFDDPVLNNGSATPRTRARASEPERADVDEIASGLADHVAEQRHGNPPPVTGAWRRDVRLLLDRDGVSVDDARLILEWLRGPGGARFWAAVILSPKKLRKHFPALAAEFARTGRTGVPDRVGAARDLADRLRAQGE